MLSDLICKAILAILLREINSFIITLLNQMYRNRPGITENYYNLTLNVRVDFINQT